MQTFVRLLNLGPLEIGYDLQMCVFLERRSLSFIGFSETQKERDWRSRASRARGRRLYRTRQPRAARPGPGRGSPASRRQLHSFPRLRLLPWAQAARPRGWHSLWICWIIAVMRKWKILLKITCQISGVGTLKILNIFLFSILR